MSTPYAVAPALINPEDLSSKKKIFLPKGNSFNAFLAALIVYLRLSLPINALFKKKALRYVRYACNSSAVKLSNPFLAFLIIGSKSSGTFKTFCNKGILIPVNLPEAFIILNNSSPGIIVSAPAIRAE